MQLEEETVESCFLFGNHSLSLGFQVLDVAANTDEEH